MQIRSVIIFNLLVFVLFQGCKYISQENVTINGNISHASEKQLYLYHLLPAGNALIDSVQTDNSGNFSISFQVKASGFYSLKLNTDNGITLVLSPGEKITIQSDGMALRSNYSVKGSKNSELYADYTKFTNANLNKVDSLSAIFAESRSNPDFITMKQRLDSAYMGVFNDQKEKVISFVNNNDESLASLLVVSNNFGPNVLLTEQTHPDLFIKLDSSLFHSYPDNDLVNTFHMRMLDFEAELADIKLHDSILKPGMQVPEIILPNSTGKEIKLSSLKGKLALVYFWSSWNALCRQTNMNLTSIYNKYHSAGFEIYAVSIDSDAELWKKSYLLDRAYWIQVNDPKGLESEYCKTFAVRAIPKMILIGKNGLIISNQPEFPELEDLIRSNL